MKRADARRNEERLLESAVEQILAVGPHPSLDAIARRAGVGIGTLYRHYPDRAALLDAVAVHVLDRAIAAARSALAEAPTGYDALRRYMHAAFDHGVGVLSILHHVEHDWYVQRAVIGPLLKKILARCKREGVTRHDLQAADIVIALIRFSRPAASWLPPEAERALARRHLDIYIAGLARSPGGVDSSANNDISP